jgi:hypothetical protein
LDGKRRPVTLKSRADHTDRTESSQDYVTGIYSIEITGFIRTAGGWLWTVRRTAAARHITSKIRPGQPQASTLRQLPLR